MSDNNEQFYSRLPVNRIALSDLFTEDHLFYNVPENWHVIITDIKSSTSAIQNGLHETVNLIATGSIVAVLNISYKVNITVPFFFGGDGATFIVPPSVVDIAMRALQLNRKNTLRDFNLELRAGTVPVKDIYALGHELKITKFSSSGDFTIPIILGDGLSYAEKVIKGEDYHLGELEAPDHELDLTGMMCRWDKIKPPEINFEVVTLLAIAAEGARQSTAYKKVISAIDEIYGMPQKRQPISVAKLKLKSTYAALRQEMRMKTGNVKMFKLVQDWFTALLGFIYFRTQSGKNYLTRLVEMSDTLVVDGKINTVITGTAQQRLLLQDALNALEEAGEIRYALYVSNESVMSCYVRDLKDDHIHFVDGAEGGYTKAAGVLKLKMKKV